jgi:hypothetical protein
MIGSGVECDWIETEIGELFFLANLKHDLIF